MFTKIRNLLSRNDAPVGTTNEMYFSRKDVQYAQDCIKKYRDQVRAYEKRLKQLAKSKDPKDARARGAVQTNLNFAKDNLQRWQQTLAEYDDRIGKFGEVLQRRAAMRDEHTSTDWVDLTEE